MPSVALVLIGLVWLGVGLAAGLLIKSFEARGNLPRVLQEKQPLGWLPYFLAAAGATGAALMIVELCSRLFGWIGRCGGWGWPLLLSVGALVEAAGVLVLLLRRLLSGAGQAGPLAKGRLFGWVPELLIYAGLVLIGLMVLAGLLRLLGRLGAPPARRADGSAPGPGQPGEQPAPPWRVVCGRLGAFGGWLLRAPSVKLAELLIAAVPAIPLAIALYLVLARLKELGGAHF